MKRTSGITTTIEETHTSVTIAFKYESNSKESLTGQFWSLGRSGRKIERYLNHIFWIFHLKVIFYIFHSKVMIIYLSEQMATNVKELAQIAAGWTKLNFHVKYNWLKNIISTPIVLIAYNCLQIPLYHLRSPDLTMWHTALPKGNQPRLNTVIFKNIIKTVSENVRNNDQSKKKNWLWLFNYLHWYTKPCN